MEEPQVEPEIKEELLPAPPTAEDLMKAERLLREARLQKMRGNKSVAGKLLDEALEVAPGAVSVLEAIADELRERRQTRAAMDLYKKALRIEPTNISVERKYAECVLGQAAVFDPLAKGDRLDPASGKIAVFLSVLAPGLGQIVTGAVPLGIGLLSGWLVGWGIAWIIPGGMEGLLGMFGVKTGGRTPDFNAAVLFPLFIAAICHIWAIYDAASKVDRRGRVNIDRPVPPVDKDFEM